MPLTSPTLATGPFQGALVAEQNDRFRTSWGADPGVQGRIVITAGVDALSMEVKAQVITAVRAFSEFTEDNDPFGLHDFGAVEITKAAAPCGSTGSWTSTTWPRVWVRGARRPEPHPPSPDPPPARRVVTAEGSVQAASPLSTLPCL